MTKCPLEKNQPKSTEVFSTLVPFSTQIPANGLVKEHGLNRLQERKFN